jgi:ABC-type oligopeptide transport system substrate-binding subunit
MQKRFAFIMMLSLTLLTLLSCNKEQDTNEKVLNLAVSAKVKGFDPVFADDRYSGNETARVYEGLLEYHYLRRPYTLVPNLAEALPEVSQDGLTYTFKIQKASCSMMIKRFQMEKAAS